MRVRLLVGSLALASLGLAKLSARADNRPQEVTAAATRDTRVEFARLAFSNDGKLLHVVGESPAERTEDQHVRAITYDAATGTVVRAVNLQPDTRVDSMTSDGRTAIVCVDCSTESRVRLLLLDTETGETQNIPSSWYESSAAKEYGDALAAALSANGQLISFYSEDGPAATLMVVSVYDWPTKTLLGKQMSRYISAGGGFGGGVTPDGKVEFVNNRTGVKVVDPKTGAVIAWFANDSVRSPDGTWVVEFPDRSFNEAQPLEAIVRSGRSAQIVGKLDMQIPESDAYGQMTGAFCGAGDRFIAASESQIAAYEIPSGKLLADFSTGTWQDRSSAEARPAVACSPRGTRMAILAGSRLTFHDVSPAE
jgi:hypothetical protein